MLKTVHRIFVRFLRQDFEEVKFKNFKNSFLGHVERFFFSWRYKYTSKGFEAILGRFRGVFS